MKRALNQVFNQRPCPDSYRDASSMRQILKKIKKERMKKIITYALMLTVVVTFLNCNGLVGDLKYLNKLKDTISKKYQTDNIDINVTNGKYLTIALTNTKYNDSTDEVKQQIAYEIGNIVHTSSTSFRMFKDSPTKNDILKQ